MSKPTGWAAEQRLSPAGGVRICGADLSQALPPGLRAAIIRAFLEHHIVIFPEQHLSREEQFAFSQNFGAVEAHRPRDGQTKRYAVAHVISNLDRHGNPVATVSRAANYHWHTDKPYNPAPPSLTTLYAVELPPAGGDTEFANATLAYEALPPDAQRRIAALRVVFAPAFEAEGSSRAVDHPLVRTHPQTGRKALYLGNHAIGILGMAETEGRALLDQLLAHATQPQFVHAHRWATGDLVMWDNRCLLHRAAANFDMTAHRRILHRSVVRGSVPF